VRRVVKTREVYGAATEASQVACNANDILVYKHATGSVRRTRPITAAIDGNPLRKFTAPSGVHANSRHTRAQRGFYASALITLGTPRARGCRPHFFTRQLPQPSDATMGISASVASTKIINDTTQNMTAGCNVQTYVVQNQDNNVVVSHCNNSNFLLKQATKTVVDCDIAQGASAMSKAVSKAGAVAKAGLGFAISTTDADVESAITENMQAFCGASTHISQTQINNVTCEDGSTNNTVVIAQDATARTQCMLTQVATAVNASSAQANADAEGLNPLNLLLGPLIAIIVIIVVIVIIVIIIKVVFKAGGAAVNAVSGDGQSVEMVVAKPGVGATTDGTGVDANGAGASADTGAGLDAPGANGGAIDTSALATSTAATSVPPPGASAPATAPAPTVVYQNAGGRMRRRFASSYMREVPVASVSSHGGYLGHKPW
jgi:hypothetical protein